MSLVWDASALLLVAQDAGADPRAGIASQAAVEAAGTESFAAPSLIDYELAQVGFVKQAEAFGTDGQEQLGNLRHLMRLIEIRIPAQHLTAGIGSLVADHRLSAYDTAYVAATDALGAVLVTEDRRLRSVARQVLAPDRALDVPGLRARVS